MSYAAYGAASSTYGGGVFNVQSLGLGGPEDCDEGEVFDAAVAACVCAPGLVYNEERHACEGTGVRVPDATPPRASPLTRSPVPGASVVTASAGGSGWLILGLVGLGAAALYFSKRGR